MCSTALQVEIIWRKYVFIPGGVACECQWSWENVQEVYLSSLEMTQLYARSTVVLVGVSVAHLFFFMMSCFHSVQKLDVGCALLHRKSMHLFFQFSLFLFLLVYQNGQLYEVPSPFQICNLFFSIIDVYLSSFWRKDKRVIDY